MYPSYDGRTVGFPSCTSITLGGIPVKVLSGPIHSIPFLTSLLFQGTGKPFQPYSLQDASEAAEENIEALDDTL